MNASYNLDTLNAKSDLPPYRAMTHLSSFVSRRLKEEAIVSQAARYVSVIRRARAYSPLYIPVPRFTTIDVVLELLEIDYPLPEVSYRYFSTSPYIDGVDGGVRFDFGLSVQK